MFRSSALISVLSVLWVVGCSGSSDGGDVDEGAIERGASRVDLSKYSLVTGLITADAESSKAISDAILGTSRKPDQSDRKIRDGVYAGLIEEGDDEPMGIVCARDGATRQHMCSLTAAVALTENVKGRAVAGMENMLLPTSAKLTGKLAAEIAAALPQRVGSGGVSAAGPVECKTADGKSECTIPLTGFGVAARLDESVKQTREDDGEAKAREAQAEFEKLIELLF